MTIFDRLLSLRAKKSNPQVQLAPVVILMRYSILQESSEPGKGAWVMNRSMSFDAYRAALFDDRRLGERITALKRVVLPSLQGQSMRLDSAWHRLIVVTSEELPDGRLAELRTTLQEYPWARVVLVSSSKRPPYGSEIRSFLAENTHEGPFATVRLDDDDALGRDYLSRLSSFVLPEHVGKAITFPDGFVGRYDMQAGVFDEFYRAHLPFNAQGLAAISHFADGAITPRTSIFDYGNHAHVGQAHPHIIDAGFPAFIRTVYPGQDTALKKRELMPDKLVDRSEVSRHVALAS